MIRIVRCSLPWAVEIITEVFLTSLPRLLWFEIVQKLHNLHKLALRPTLRLGIFRRIGSSIANQLRYEALRSEQEAATPDTNANTSTDNIRSHLIRTCNIPDNTIPDAINHDAIAHIRKCVRQVIMNKPHECGLSRHPAPYIQPTRVPFGHGDLVGNSFEHRSSRTAQIYLIAPSLEYIENDHDAHTTHTTIQLRVYYRTVPDMQHPIPTYGSVALPEYLLSHHTTVRVDTPTVMTEPSRTDHSRNMWPISDRAHDIELLRQYHSIAHIICQRFQTNPNEGGRWLFIV